MPLWESLRIAPVEKVHSEHGAVTSGVAVLCRFWNLPTRLKGSVRVSQDVLLAGGEVDVLQVLILFSFITVLLAVMCRT